MDKAYRQPGTPEREQFPEVFKLLTECYNLGLNTADAEHRNARKLPLSFDQWLLTKDLPKFEPITRAAGEDELGVWFNANEVLPGYGERVLVEICPYPVIHQASLLPKREDGEVYEKGQPGGWHVLYSSGHHWLQENSNFIPRWAYLPFQTPAEHIPYPDNHRRRKMNTKDVIEDLGFNPNNHPEP